MGAISRPEFVTCLWPDLTNQKEQHMVKLRVQKLELDLIYSKREIKKKCAENGRTLAPMWLPCDLGIFRCYVTIANNIVFFSYDV